MFSDRRSEGIGTHHPDSCQNQSYFNEFINKAMVTRFLKDNRILVYYEKNKRDSDRLMLIGFSW